MNKTYNVELSRLFLVEGLPAPLTPASSHLQLFDNYIANTRIRLRSIRVPETNEWSHSLQQRVPAMPVTSFNRRIAEMHLNEAEHSQFEMFAGNEIRKNRYFHEFDGQMVSFDVYLGTLWGLNRARVDFQTEEELRAFRLPPFAIFEVTEDEFFDDANLVNQKFEDVQIAVGKLQPSTAAPPEG